MSTPLGPQIRPPREDDVDALLAVRHACAAQDGFDPLSTVESLPTRDDLMSQVWGAAAQPERFPLVQFQDEVLGYGRVYNWTEADGMRVWLHVGWVTPEWRGKGIGTMLVRDLEMHIRGLAEGEGGRWEFAANASSTEPQATQLLLDNGYRPGYTVLEMGLDWAAFAPGESLTLPQGFASRPASTEDAPAIAQSVYVAYSEEYAGERFHEPMDVAQYARELVGPGFDPTLWQVAWAGEEVAGQVIALIEGGRAEIYEVSVRPAYRRRGLARALLARVLADLRARDVAAVRLHTMAEFPTRAVDLYRSLGFATLKEFPRYRKSAG